MEAGVSARMMYMEAQTYLVRLKVHVIVPDLVDEPHQVDKGHIVLIRSGLGLHELYCKTKEASGLCFHIR